MQVIQGGTASYRAKAFLRSKEKSVSESERADEYRRAYYFPEERIARKAARVGAGERGRAKRAAAQAERVSERAALFIPARDAFVEYRAYCNAKRRCTDPGHPNYERYGGRGVEFRFANFIEFFDEVGPRPAGRTPKGRAIYSLHRIDNDGHYEIGNVCWATQKEQCAPGNRRAPTSVTLPSVVLPPSIAA
jgi:hypothetical protein